MDFHPTNANQVAVSMYYSKSSSWLVQHTQVPTNGPKSSRVLEILYTASIHHVIYFYSITSFGKPENFGFIPWQVPISPKSPIGISVILMTISQELCGRKMNLYDYCIGSLIKILPLTAPTVCLGKLFYNSIK
jgi:hypothetical protein